MSIAERNPIIRAVTVAAVLIAPLTASGRAPKPPDVEGNFGQVPGCPVGEHEVYLRPPHPGSTTRAVSREPSTVFSRLSLLKRRIDHPDFRASTTFHDVVDVFTPDQPACK